MAKRIKKPTQWRPADMQVLVIGDRVWGRGDTLEAARLAASKPRSYIAYICTPGTYVDDMGYICFPTGMNPKEIIRAGIAKKKKEGRNANIR